jgi:pyruvate dehydrogenase E2 component (dihydrolipoamide acetyltransferase)
MPELFVRGRRIGYESNPADFDVTKTVILFVHGTGGDRDDWRSQLDDLSVPGSVIAMELPGHGISDPPGETTVSAYAEWVEGFVETLRLKRV